MINIAINDRQVLDALYDLQHRMGDMTPVMREIGGMMERRIQGRFETETDPMGNAWADWADSYNPAMGGNRPSNGNSTLLDLYGDMLNSLSWQADKDSVTVGFGAGYVAYHEFGTSKMPRRGMIFDNPNAGTIAEDDQRAIFDILQDYLAI